MPELDVFKRGARVISVFGPFASRALVEMSADLACELFDGPLSGMGRTKLVEAVERDLAVLGELDPKLPESALAASALALAYEIEHPYNSATSKSMCAKQLRETLDRLRELAPDVAGKDEVDDLSKRRAERLAGRSTA